jgi:hypothetical protein
MEADTNIAGNAEPGRQSPPLVSEVFLLLGCFVVFGSIWIRQRQSGQNQPASEMLDDGPEATLDAALKRK